MSGLTVRRGRSRDLPAILSTLEPLEPRTTHITGWLLDRGLDRRFSRLHVAARGDGSLGGLLLVARQSPERWCAWPYLADPGAAAALAPLADAAPAWWLEGPEPDIESLLPLLRRGTGHRLFPMPHLAMVPARPFGTPTPASGLATMADLDELAHLYRDFELPLAATRYGLRRVIRDRLERGLVVIVRRDDMIAGSMWTQVRSRSFWMLNALTVRPSAREQGVAWDLVNRALALCAAVELGAVAVIADTNPMAYPEPAVSLGAWCYVTLDAPKRFRGHARLRHLVEQANPVTPRDAERFEVESGPSRPDAT